MTEKMENQNEITAVAMEQTTAAALLKINKSLNTAKSDDELLQIMAQPAVAVGSVGGDLMRFDLDETGTPEWTELVAAWRAVGESAVPVGSRFRLADFPLSTLWLENPDEPQLMGDVSKDERADERLRALLARSGLRAMAMIPLVQAGRWVGMITFNWDAPHEFTEEETGFFRALAGLAAPVVENRRLLDQAQQALVERERAEAERVSLQQEIIEAQKQAIQDLSTPIIPIMDRIVAMPLVGSIDTLRARDIMRGLLAGIREHRAKVVILDVTGVPIMDSGVVSHLNKTIQAAQLKGARAIVTGLSDAVAESIVDLGIDWSGVTTLSDLQTGLRMALNSLGIELSR